jgi:hypothetical protein
MSAKPLLVGVLCSFALPATVVLLLGGCAGTTRSDPSPVTSSPAAAKPAAAVNLVPTYPPADLGAVERFAWQQVVQLGDAFAKGDVDGFLSRVSRGFYRGYSTLEKSLKALMEHASARAAVVAVRLVSEEDGKVSVRAEWTRSVTRPDGSVELRHGETVFLFLKSDTNLRLLDYRGDAPFAIDGI